MVFEEFRTRSPSRRSAGSCVPWGRKLSARPRHRAQAAGAIEGFKKASPRAWRPSREKALNNTIEIWFADQTPHRSEGQDHPPIGEARHARHDQRTASTYIFGAACPHQDKGAALILPACNTEAMNLHLRGDRQSCRAYSHAVLLVDQAGW